MNFLKIKTKWSNAELIVMKLCIASAYILIGTYFQRFLSDYYVPLLLIFVVTVFWAMYLWITKMKSSKLE